MPDILFSAEFLKPYLEKFRLSAVPGLNHKKAILENWQESIKSGKFHKEEEAKSRFVTDLFGEVLGFNYKNTRKWQIKEEHKSVVGSVKPDAALGTFKLFQQGLAHEVHIVVEVKGPKVGLDKAQNRIALQITPVDQAFLYASRSGGQCKWVVVTNFYEIRFYHYSGQEACQTYTLDSLQDEEVLREFLFLFHKDRLTNEVKAATEKLYELRDLANLVHNQEQHILDQLYDTLKSFDGLGFIDPNFLSNIKPFNVREERVWHYDQGRFLTANLEISELLQGYQVEDGKPVFLPDYVQKLKKAKVAEPTTKLAFILKQLAACAITQIFFFKDKKERLKVIASGGRNLKYMNHQEFLSVDPHLNPTETCNCLNCLFRTLDFKALIQKVKDGETEGNLEPLEEAYGHYLLSTDNFKKAYFLYKRSELQLSSTDNKVGYFIAKINQLQLPGLIQSYNEQVDSRILADIRSIDLDRSLYQELDLYVAEHVRQYLIEVKEHKLFQKIKDEVQEIALKVEKKTHTLQDLNTLHWHYNVLHFYFHKNYFVYDIFKGYRDLVTTIFRAIIISFRQPEPLLDDIQVFHLTEAVLYVQQKEFKELIQAGGDIKVQDDRASELVVKAINLLHSQNREGVWGRRFKEDELASQLLNYHFRDNYTRIFANLFALLAKIDFPEDKLPKGLAQPIVGIVQTEDFLDCFDLKELGEFICRYGMIFTAVQLLDMLKHAIRNQPYGNHKYSELIVALSTAHAQYYPQTKIKDLGLLKTAIANHTDHSGWANLKELLCLFPIFNEDGQRYLLAEYEASLKANFNEYMYYEMLKNGIVSWDKGELFNTYIDYIQKSKRGGMYIKDGEPKYYDFFISNLIHQLHSLNIPLNTPVLQTLTNLTDFERWVMNPTEFDYKAFSPEWLLAIDDSILGKLGTITAISEQLCQFLIINDHPQLAKIYFRYFARFK